MKILVKIPYLTISVVLVLAKKDKHDSSSESSSSEESLDINFHAKKPETSIDMSGDLRKYFSLEAALLDTNRNMICSPMSALLPLAKLALGSEKKAEEELLSAIGLRKSSHIEGTFKNIIKELEYLPGVTLDIASRLYVNKGVKIRDSFRKSTTKIFKSCIETVRMSDQAGAAGEINDWVSKQTRGMIPNLIRPDDISPDTVIVLVNAIFFVGFWKTPFTILSTDNFNTPSGIRRVPMMSQVSSVKYRQDDVLNAQVVEIPYVGEDSSFIILLPFKQGGLPIMLKQLKLAPALLPKALDQMREMKVNLTIPKFKIETQLNLMSLYKKIGLKNIFEAKSTLTRIAKGKPLYVTKAIQKAVIEVNELGSKAAAASAVSVVKLSYQPTIQFHADSPFLFFVKAKSEQLFAGTFISPANEGYIKLYKKF